MPLSPLASHLVLFVVLPLIALGLTWVLVLADRKLTTPDRVPQCAHGWDFDACPVSWGKHLNAEHAPDEPCACDPFTYECLDVNPSRKESPASLKPRQEGQNPRLRSKP